MFIQPASEFNALLEKRAYVSKDAISAIFPDEDDFDAVIEIMEAELEAAGFDVVWQWDVARNREAAHAAVEAAWQTACKALDVVVYRPFAQMKINPV